MYCWKIVESNKMYVTHYTYYLQSFVFKSSKSWLSFAFFQRSKKSKKDLIRQTRFDPTTFTFSENSNYGRETEYKGWSTSQWNAIVPASYSKIRYFFILQSLTTSKMRQFQTLKLSQFHKEKTCWTENWWSSGIMSNF